LLSFASHALTTEQAYAMAAADDSEQRVLAINQAVLAPDAQTDGGRLSAYLARSPTMKCACPRARSMW
jgi:urea transport system permease protein